MTDLYWQAASSVAALAIQNARLNQVQGEDEELANSHSCALPDFYQDSSDFNNQSLAYQELQSEQTCNTSSEVLGKGARRKERKSKNSQFASSSSLLKLKKQSSTS